MNIKLRLKTLFYPVLLFVSLLVTFIYKLRRKFYQLGLFKQFRFEVLTISIGNVTFGGTGKTPLVVFLTEFFEKNKKEVLVLTRGYKGAAERVGLFAKAQDFLRLNAEAMGDEPYLILGKMKFSSILVGKKRAENLMKFWSKLSAEVLILDDGFQHLKIARDIDIVLFDATLNLDQYEVVPIGYLREALSTLKCADVVIISRSNQVSLEKINSLEHLIRQNVRKDTLVIKMFYKFNDVVTLKNDVIGNIANLGGVRAIALTALASPKSFIASLNDLEISIVKEIYFPDHHFFSKTEIDKILSELNDQEVIICTEKDAVKLKQITQDSRIVYLPVKVSFNDEGENDLIEFIRQKDKILSIK